MSFPKIISFDTICVRVRFVLILIILPHKRNILPNKRIKLPAVRYELNDYFISTTVLLKNTAIVITSVI